MPSTAVYARFIRLRQRTTDWLRERRIEALKRQMQHSLALHGNAGRAAMWRELETEINSRSPAQVERMERRMGLR